MCEARGYGVWGWGWGTGMTGFGRTYVGEIVRDLVPFGVLDGLGVIAPEVGVIHSVIL